MAVFIQNCPHCGARNMTFRVFGAVHPPSADLASGKRTSISVGAECQGCWKPVSAHLRFNGHLNGHGQLQHFEQHIFPHLTKDLANVASLDFAMLDSWPKAAPSRIPDHLPAPVRSAFAQGEINFSTPDCDEAAATMYRRALDLALKQAYPDLKGDLYKKIEALVANNVVPTAIGEWAHEVRIVGNDGAHDLEGTTRDDVRAARDFIDAVLQYIYSLPQAVALRRAAPQPVEG
jgi:hypothetical protein